MFSENGERLLKLDEIISGIPSTFKGDEPEIDDSNIDFSQGSIQLTTSMEDISKIKAI